VPSLRDTFDEAAELYHHARPDYPEALFDDMVALTGLRPGARLLEIGCGTGKATIPLARRGFAITCVELGGRLSAVAARNLAGYPGVSVLTAPFETWRPAEPAGYDLVFAATAWHWLDPATRYRRAWELLRPGGHLAYWGATHAFPDGGDPFFVRIQPVYEEIGMGMAPGETRPRPGGLPDERAEIEATGLFGDVRVRHHDWQIRYDADSYLDLLRTFSGHIAMAGWQRDRLFTAIRDLLSQRPEPYLYRHWGAVLHTATRR
jgi:SAM-dependent methyltransferase